jgi:hypothetical protein
MASTFVRSLVGTFRWHLVAFTLVNGVLSAANVITGPPWWSFWPLLGTGFVLALHYFAYKTATATERWAADRAEELNLKSYDRSHIEDLKTRYRSEGRGLERKP